MDLTREQAIELFKKMMTDLKSGGRAQINYHNPECFEIEKNHIILRLYYIAEKNWFFSKKTKYFIEVQAYVLHHEFELTENEYNEFKLNCDDFEKKQEDLVQQEYDERIKILLKGK